MGLLMGSLTLSGLSVTNAAPTPFIPVSLEMNEFLNEQNQLTLVGQVQNRANQPLAGVKVSLLNKTGQLVRTLATDEKGEYSFQYGTPGTEFGLSFSLMGYEIQNLRGLVVKAGQNVLPLVYMEEQISTLDEVVVTGQGMSVSKRRLSTNVTVISGKTLDDSPVQRMDQLLQSQVPNTLFKLTGGQSGATSIIQSRGFNSAFANSTPIIYVDGVRVDNLNTATNIGMSLSGGISQGASTSALADLPVENIERVEFINGGAATTLYGSDAANGVLQIFTKKSGDGRASFNFGTDLGVETATADFHYFDRTKDVLYKDGFYQKYNLGVNGKGENIGYSVTGSYSNNSGVLIHNQNQNEKLDFRVGLNAQLMEGMTYESSFSYNNQSLSRSRNGNSGGYSGLWFVEDGASKII